MEYHFTQDEMEIITESFKVRQRVYNDLNFLFAASKILESKMDPEIQIKMKTSEVPGMFDMLRSSTQAFREISPEPEEQFSNVPKTTLSIIQKRDGWHPDSDVA